MNPRWTEYKRKKAQAFYQTKSADMLQTNNLDYKALVENIKLTVEDFNRWLVSGRSINSEHPYTIFVNYLKKQCAEQLTSAAKKALNTSNIRVDHTDRHITSIKFFDTNWPQWAHPFLEKLREATEEALGASPYISHSGSEKFYARIDNIVDTINSFSFKD